MGSEHRSACPQCGSFKYHTPQEKWDQFLDPARMRLDTPQPHAADVINYMRDHGYLITYLTGRNESLRTVTEEWLFANHFWKPETEPVLMRPLNLKDTAASVVKEQLFLRYRERRCTELSQFLFFDDDKFVLPMWQKYGMVFLCPQAWEFMNPVTFDRAHEPTWNR